MVYWGDDVSTVSRAVYAGVTGLSKFRHGWHRAEQVRNEKGNLIWVDSVVLCVTISSLSVLLISGTTCHQR